MNIHAKLGRVRILPRFLALTAVVVAAAVPSAASAGQQYFFSYPPNLGTLYGGQSVHGDRHSLIQISVRGSTSNNLCVYGAREDDMYDRNTANYCIVSGSLGESPILGGILRWPWVKNYTGGQLSARALSEW